MKMATVRRFALQLPEITEQPHHHDGSFRVRGKIFVTALIAKAWAQRAPRELQAPPGLAADARATDASARRRVARPTRPQADVHE